MAVMHNWFIVCTEEADEHDNFVPKITVHHSLREAIERVQVDLREIAPTEDIDLTPNQIAQRWRELTNGDCIFGMADLLREMVAAADAADAVRREFCDH